MKSVAKWSIENKVTVNLIMIMIIIAGFFSMIYMKRELFPRFSLDMIQINVVYPGASPEEIEKGICIKIEEAVEGIEGISRVISNANENSGTVYLELETDADARKVKDDVQTAIDVIDTFPEDAEEPVVTEIEAKDAVVFVSVYGDTHEKTLREIAERVKDDLLSFPEISQVSLAGARDFEISVEISEAVLRKYSLTFDDIANAIKTESLDIPGGAIKTASGEISIRAKGERYTGLEFEKIPVITLNDGATIYLGDIAKITDGFADVDIENRFNGKTAVMLQIFKTDKEDAIKISDRVKKYVEQANKNMSDNVKLSTWFDVSPLVKSRINLLLKNGIQGIILVFILLMLFLDMHLALWVAAGIPISFMGAFLILYFTGNTLNMVSLFAFIMALGIIVDDAIVIGENVYTHFSAGKKFPKEVVIDGVKQVGAPILMAVSTTIAAFAPLLFIKGILGKFISILPGAVIIILLASLGEALIILPSHLHHALESAIHKKEGKIRKWHKKIRSKIDKGLDYTINSIYIPAIKYSLKNRYFTLSISLGALIISVGIIIGGYVPFVFFPKGDSNWVVATVVYPLGTPFDVTEKTIEKLEKETNRLNEIFKKKLNYKKDVITGQFSLVGAIVPKEWIDAVTGENCGEVWIEIIPSEERPDISATEFGNKWRELTGEIPGVEELTFSFMEGIPAPMPIEVQLMGDNFETLRKASEELKAKLKTYVGLFDIKDNFKPGKLERQIKIRDGAKSLGISMAEIGKQIRQAFYGEEALTIQRGQDDLKVRVRYTENERRSLAGIEDMRIRTVDGREIPIEEVADLSFGRSYSTIKRIDKKRVITVSADLDTLVANASEITAELKKEFLPNLMDKYHGVKYDLEGEAKRTEESINSLKKGFALALMAIFLILAAQFKSYSQPVIVMAVIPFGFVGAVLGHIILGISFTLLSAFGIVALAGIVVNDSLILIDFINHAREEGMELNEAVINSGISRFRPVILTSITTMGGLFPLLLEKSFQAQFLIPMAASIFFGLFAATLLTLIFVPSLYMILQDIIKKVDRRLI